jgi:hypothetical protein
MAGEFSTVGAGIALDAATGRVTQTGRTTYLALLTSAPSDSTTIATMAEVSTAGYARQAVAWSAPTGDPALTSNSALLTFGPFTADPPNVTHCALVSSSSGTTGDLIMYWTLDVAKDAAINESIQVAIAGLSMSLD